MLWRRHKPVATLLRVAATCSYSWAVLTPYASYKLKKAKYYSKECLNLCGASVMWVFNGTKDYLGFKPSSSIQGSSIPPTLLKADIITVYQLLYNLFLPLSHASLIAISEREGKTKIINKNRNKNKLPRYRGTWKWQELSVKPCTCSDSIQGRQWNEVLRPHEKRM